VAFFVEERLLNYYLAVHFVSMKSYILLVCLVISINTSAQKTSDIISGPMLGQVELSTAEIWIQVSPSVKSVTVRFWKSGQNENAKVVSYTGVLGKESNPIKIILTGLDYNSSYQYQFVLNKNRSIASMGQFKTQDLWQWRKPAPDFSFLAGSCTYINYPVNDRPGRPYGNDSSIFKAMAAEKASFMLWLGDNWYTREVDYYSEWGLYNRASKDRSLKILQPFLQSMSHYAIWDDHDYGPNNADKSFVFKETSRNVFMTYWCNPTFGENGQGIYTKFTYNDVDFFLLDDRWFRSNDNTPDSTNGQLNQDKMMFGKQQMEWFKNAIRQSQENNNISFRIIATGSQVLNPLSSKDCFRHYSKEYLEMMDFLQNEKIDGVVFLTGDRHLSEIYKINRKGSYPLHDITASPLTAGFSSYGPNEKQNQARILSIEKKQNYARISVTGQGSERKLLVDFMGIKGEKLAEYSVALKDITNKNKQ
jgi:alkaline phosphatase D